MRLLDTISGISWGVEAVGGLIDLGALFYGSFGGGGSPLASVADPEHQGPLNGKSRSKSSSTNAPCGISMAIADDDGVVTIPESQSMKSMTVVAECGTLTLLDDAAIRIEKADLGPYGLRSTEQQQREF